MIYLYFALFLLLNGAVMLLLDFLIRKAAYDPEERYLQARAIVAVFVLLLAAANVYTVSQPLLLVDRIINSPVLAPVIAIVLPQRAFGVLYLLLALLGINILAMAAILLVVRLVRTVFTGRSGFIRSDSLEGSDKFLHLIWLLIGRYYEEDDNGVHTKDRATVAYLWIRGMKWSFLVLWIAEILTFALSILWGSDEWNETLRTVGRAWYLLPMAGYELFVQIQLFLEGELPSDEAGSFGSTEIEEHLVGDVYDLADHIAKRFGESGALLYSEKGDARKLERDGLGSNEADNDQLEACTQPEVLQFLSDQLRRIGVDGDKGRPWLDALGALLSGKSVSIRDQADGEFLIYLSAYLNYYLAQGATALILCPDEDAEEKVSAQLNKDLARINTLHNVWAVRCCNRTAVDGQVNLDGRMNILVCTLREFSNLHLAEKYRSFSDALFCVMIMDSIRLFSQDGIHVSEVFNELYAVKHPLQYVVVDSEKNGNLRTAAENAARQRLQPFNNDVRLSKTCLMVWKEESRCRLQRFVKVGNSLTPYVGAALPLSLAGLEFGMPRVFLLSDPSRCEQSYLSALTDSAGGFAEYFGKSFNLNTSVCMDRGRFMEPQDLCMAITYDTEYNMFSALWRWMKYGGEDGTLLHVISPPYLLRDYFAANFKSRGLLMNSHEFDALMSGSLGLDVSRMAAILTAICGGDMTTERLMELSRSYNWPYKNEEKLLAECLRVVLSREEFHSVYERVRFTEVKSFSPEEDKYVSRTYITLDDNTRRRVMELAEFGEMVVRNTVRREPLPILRRNLHNYYLRGQLASFGGEQYRITSVRDGKVNAERETAQPLMQYYPISRFVFKDFEQIDSCVDYSFADMDLCRAHVTRSIFGYWSSSDGNDFTSSGMLFNDLRREDGSEKEDSMGNAGIFEISLRRDSLGGRCEAAAALAAFMLTELCKTLFPYTWQNLYVMTDGNPDEELLERIQKQGEGSSLEDRVRSVIPWVERSDEKDSVKDNDYITIYAVEFSSIEYGMTQILYNRRESVLRMLWEYLRWALDGEKGEDGAVRPKKTYLNFGADSVPDVFAPKELFGLLSRLPDLAEEVRDPDLLADKAEDHCTFCGRPVRVFVRMGDGRCMCNDCKKHQLTGKEEIKGLYSETVSMMEKRYGIKLRRNIHLRFKSAEEIAKKVGNSFNGRVLGFYVHRWHNMWIESRGPRVAVQSVLIHELTHSWQHDRLKLNALKRRFPKAEAEKRLRELMEGHAMYVEIDAMRRENEDYAERIFEDTMNRQDEYGTGYRLLRDYISEKEKEGSHMNAFTAMESYVNDLIKGRDPDHAEAE